MKKVLLVVLFLFAAVAFFYGVVASLVNQGQGLMQALLTFVLVGAGALALVWFARPDE